MPDMNILKELSLEDQALQVVYLYAKNDVSEPNRNLELQREQVKLVWFCKLLQNWKALVFIPDFPGEYYEVTFDGDAQEIYLDIYRKFDNISYGFVRTEPDGDLVGRHAVVVPDTFKEDVHASQR
jgi:hypothetical protein